MSEVEKEDVVEVRITDDESETKKSVMWLWHFSISCNKT